MVFGERLDDAPCSMKGRKQTNSCSPVTHRTHEEDRPHAPYASTQLFQGYFKARKEFSSGVVEGLNNKATITMRRSYGFRTFRILRTNTLLLA
jgi:hypothetical protein